MMGTLLLIALVLSGCTLSGTGAVPLTPPEDMGAALLPTPTISTAPNVFATQTMVAQSAVVPTATPMTADITGTPGDDAEATPEGTPEAEPTETETDEPGDTPAGDCDYTIEAGDTLFSIALAYDTTVAAIASANGIADPDSLDVGDVLTIPGCGGGTGGTGSTGGSTGGSTATGGDTVYIVQPGDNLFRIALSYGIDWQDLAAYNGISDPTSLSIGQQILIPAG